MNFNYIKNKKAQGALEYLLIIGGALLIAVIVIVLMSGMSRSKVDTVGESEESYQQMVDQTIINPIISEVNCTISDVTIYMSPSPSKGVKGYCLVIDGSSNGYADCNSYVAGSVQFTGFRTALISGDTHNISLVAQKNDSYSSSSKPSMRCTVE
jgi:uncharacterized protein (UPF0333 family)